VSTSSEVATREIVHFLYARFDEDERLAKIIKSSQALATVEAHRRIVHDLGGFFGLDDFSRGLVDHTIRVLAGIYADHPDYREGWKP
jgi:hypothetical protein